MKNNKKNKRLRFVKLLKADMKKGFVVRKKLDRVEQAIYNTSLGIAGVMIVLAMTLLVQASNYLIQYHIAAANLNSSEINSQIVIMLTHSETLKMYSTMMLIIFSFVILLLLLLKGNKRDGSFIGNWNMELAIMSAVFAAFAFFMLLSVYINPTLNMAVGALGIIVPLLILLKVKSNFWAIVIFAVILMIQLLIMFGVAGNRTF